MNNNGNGRILSLDGAKSAKTDTQGRVLKHNATIEEVHQIVAEECAKVHEYYLNQIPPFVARMIQDALLSFGLIKMDPAVEANLVATAINEATPETPADAIPASGDTTSPDSRDSIAAAEGPSGLPYEAEKFSVGEFTEVEPPTDPAA